MIALFSMKFIAPPSRKKGNGGGRVSSIEGRLPHGMGVARLADMPAEWSRQHQMLGLPPA
jgi:hypothetical protein